MRKLILGLLAAAIVAAPVALTAAPAQADYNGNRRCMSKYEWKKITEYHYDEATNKYYFGSTQDQVYSIVGNYGRIDDRTEYSDGEVDLDITFRQCLPSGETASRYSRVYMSFSNWSQQNDHPVDFFYVDYKGSWSRPSKNY